MQRERAGARSVAGGGIRLVYYLPQELPRFMAEWWTVHDAMRVWGCTEEEARVDWLLRGAELGVTSVIAHYPGGSLIEYAVIPAGSPRPRWRNAARGGAAAAAAEPTKRGTADAGRGCQGAGGVGRAHPADNQTAHAAGCKNPG